MMTTPDWYEKALFAVNEWEVNLFNKTTAMLPKGAEEDPPHCEAHSLRSLRMAVDLLGCYYILETGFNLGHSAAMFLSMDSIFEVQSIDPTLRENSLIAERALRESFPGCFFMMRTCAKDLLALPELPCNLAPEPSSTLAFIDGDHTEEGVTLDIQLMRRLGIKKMLFDDWFPQWGPGVQPAIEKAGLIPVALLGNQALCYERDVL